MSKNELLEKKVDNLEKRFQDLNLVCDYYQAKYKATERQVAQLEFERKLGLCFSIPIPCSFCMICGAVYDLILLMVRHNNVAVGMKYGLPTTLWQLVITLSSRCVELNEQHDLGASGLLTWVVS